MPPEPLQRRILRDYPQPIAAAYRAVCQQRNPQARALPLAQLLDSLLHYLAAVAVSAYLRSNLDHPQANERLLQTLLAPTWTSGKVLGLCREALAGVRDGGLPLPCAELTDFFFQADDTGLTGDEQLSRLVALRNDLAHHGVHCEQQLHDGLEAVLGRMSWLSREHLVRPVQIDDATVRTVDLLHGDLPLANHEWAFGLDRDDLGHEFTPIRADRDSLLLVRRDGSAYLPFYPLARFLLEPDAVWFFQGAEWNTDTQPPRLRQATFTAFSGTGRPLTEERVEHACRCLEQHVARLRQRLPDEQRRKVVREVVQARPAADPDHTLAGVHDEQQSHHKHFVGRDPALARIAAWIDQQTTGRYLLLLGPPGQGKSALMAELAGREEKRGGCLLHMVKSHASPRRFLPALLSQAARLAETTFGAPAYSGDIDDLREALRKGLTAVVQKAGRAVVVHDALDELDAEGRLATFLSPSLPEGVRVVLTCRPDIPLVQTLKARLHGHLDVQELEPLAEDDFRQLLEHRLGAEGLAALERQAAVGELFRRAAGNALCLNNFAERAAERRQRSAETFVIGLEDMAATQEEVFEQLYDRIRDYRDGRQSERGRRRERLLHSLSVAREALTLEQLAELESAAGEPLLLGECRDCVREMSACLLESSGRFKPWHQGLTDLVRQRMLGEAGVRQREAIFGRWLEQPASAASSYGLRYRIRHLLAAGRASDAAALLQDIHFLEARAGAGLAFELAADFAATAAALPAGVERRRLELLEEALRRDIHFIDRHTEDYPAALFQSLWNHAWWYDCPEAAQHYVEGRAPGQDAGLGLHGLLERWREAKGQQPGFVWLRSLRPPPVHLATALKQVFQGHESVVRSVAVSPDGRRLASGSDDKTVRVWDATSGAELLCLQGHEDGVWCVAFSPDGRRLASGSMDKTVRVWDATSGAELLRLQGHESSVYSVAFSSDGRRLASGEYDRTVRVWDAVSGAELLRLQGHESWVTSVAFSPDGRRLASGSEDKTVRVWDATSGAELLRFQGHEDRVFSVAFSPDGRRLASGSEDQTVRVWDAASGAELFCLQGHEDRVFSVAFSPDGRRLASGSEDQTVRVWDAATGAELCRRQGPTSGVWSVAFSPDGRRLASGVEDNTVQVWDVASGAKLLRLQGHESRVFSVAFSSDGRRLASGEYDRTVRVWDAVSGAELLRLQGHESWVTSVAFSPDGRRLASGSADQTVRVWDAARGQCLEVIQGMWFADEVFPGSVPSSWRAVSPP